MDIVEATRSYEEWLGRWTTVVRADLALKHRRMAESPFVFLRGTFYRWMQLWPKVCGELARTPRVLAIGDLHVENFGTWRDIEGRLVWGVNDVDEASRLPYTVDLTRLATSALLAIRATHFSLSGRSACEAILDGYRAALASGGRPFVLAEHRRWLRRSAMSYLRDPVMFWPKLTSSPPARGPLPHSALRAMLPDRKLSYRAARRVAGVGSLGRPRFVAIANWGGALIAREAKAAVPSASVWARGGSAGTVQCATILQRAVRVPDPFFAVRGDWIVRRLAPDCTRIELTDLPERRDETKLLRAMGWETGNLHLGTANPRHVAANLDRLPRRWLEQAARQMAKAVVRDWRDWIERS
jgi:uncharacterized protein (DUF2252 family)